MNPSLLLAYISFGALFLSLQSPSFKVLVQGVPLYAPEIFTLAAALFSVMALKKVYFPENRVVIAVFFIVLGAGISFLINPFSLTGLGMLKTWFVFPLLASLAVYSFVRERGNANFFLALWLIFIFGVSLTALQFLIHGVFTYDGRLQGIYSSPNFLAVTLAPGILIALYFFLTLEKSSGRILLVCFVLLLLVLLYFTRSYSIWGATLASTFLLFFMHGDMRLSKKVIVLSLLVLALILLFEKNTEKWQDLVSLNERSSFSSRLMIWEAGEKIYLDHPLFGIGVGRFQEEYLNYQKYFPPYLEWAVPQPHNFFLAIALQSGLMGLLGFTALIVHYFLLLVKKIKRLDVGESLLPKVYVSLMALYLIYGMVDTPYFKTDLTFLFWILIALGLASIDERKNLSEERF